jgi:hypothetical protein
LLLLQQLLLKLLVKQEMSKWGRTRGTNIWT